MTPSLLDGALPLVDADKATEHFLKMMTEVAFEKVCQKLSSFLNDTEVKNLEVGDTIM